MSDAEPLFLTAPRAPRAVARALSYVDAHLCEPLTAQALATHAASSPHHFHRLFAAHMGCSVGEYITWRRLQRAAALLASGREAVLQIALEVGFESGQSLAKAMRRVWGVTPTAVRRGQAHPHILADTPWYQGRGPVPARQTTLEIPMVTLTRYAQLPSGLRALTTTARGMVKHTLQRSAQLAFAELTAAVQQAGLWDQAWSWIAICPDEAQGPDDPNCRYVAGVLFGYAMHVDQGRCVQPPLPLSGTLAWQDVAAGRYAVFTHRGSYATLYLTWASIYRDWVPSAEVTLRDEPPLELMLNSPADTPEEDLLTEIWMPVA